VVVAFARRRFYDFLTGTSRTARDAALAAVGRSLGQMAHLIQDATSPPHTRNDTHLVYDGYEANMERFRLDEAARFDAILSSRPSPPARHLHRHGDDQTRASRLSAATRTQGGSGRRHLINSEYRTAAI
jgi:hypothetical protein